MKAILIKTCSDCPLREIDSSGKDAVVVCGSAARDRPVIASGPGAVFLPNAESVPDWCPLDSLEDVLKRIEADEPEQGKESYTVDLGSVQSWHARDDETGELIRVATMRGVPSTPDPREEG